jgi:hypothetical protein
MDALSIICLLVKLLVRWFHSVCGSLCLIAISVHLEIAFCRTHFSRHLSACLYRSKSSALPAELFLDDRHTLPPPPLCVDCSVHTFQIGFCLSNLLACLYRLKLLRSLFLWQSCFSMVGIQRHLRELFCSHLSDSIFLSVASDTCFLHVSLDFSIPCTLFTWNSDWIFLSVASDTCFLHVSLNFYCLLHIVYVELMV